MQLPFTSSPVKNKSSFLVFDTENLTEKIMDKLIKNKSIVHLIKNIIAKQSKENIEFIKASETRDYYQKQKKGVRGRVRMRK